MFEELPTWKISQKSSHIFLSKQTNEQQTNAGKNNLIGASHNNNIYNNINHITSG